MKNAIRKERIDADKYVNIETGESLASEMTPHTRLNKDVLTGHKIIEFEDFVASDTAIELDIIWDVSPADYRRFRVMANYLHTDYNIVMSGNNQPFTLETLSELIRLNKDDTTRFINRLYEIGLIFYGIIPGSKYKKRVYAINPVVMKKRTKIDAQMLTLFPNFRKGKGPAKNNKKTAKKLSSLQPEQAN